MNETPANWLMNVPLAPLTTFEVGGPAEYFVSVHTQTELQRALAFARAHAIPVTLLGGGSNVLIADAGIEGVVIQLDNSEIEQITPSTIRAAAGTDWDSLVDWAVHRGLAGLECLSGIPGRVGAAPIQNVGAYGRDVAEVIESVTAIDRLSGESVEMTNAQCGFRYRSSIFKTHDRDRFVITAVQFALTLNGKPELRYRDLLKEFPTRRPPIAQVREAVLRIRRSKSMVWDTNDPNHRSAGSFFVNPILSAARADAIDEVTGETAPRFPTSSQDVKVPAAWLIERAGFYKGLQSGNAGISTAHALALINRGGATASEIDGLSRSIQRAVLEKFGVTLKPEPVQLGFA